MFKAAIVFARVNGSDSFFDLFDWRFLLAGRGQWVLISALGDLSVPQFLDAQRLLINL